MSYSHLLFISKFYCCFLSYSPVPCGLMTFEKSCCFHFSSSEGGWIWWKIGWKEMFAFGLTFSNGSLTELIIKLRISIPYFVLILGKFSICFSKDWIELENLFIGVTFVFLVYILRMNLSLISSSIAISYASCIIVFFSTFTVQLVHKFTSAMAFCSYLLKNLESIKICIFKLNF